MFVYNYIYIHGQNHLSKNLVSDYYQKSPRAIVVVVGGEKFQVVICRWKGVWLHVNSFLYKSDDGSTIHQDILHGLLGTLWVVVGVILLSTLLYIAPLISVVAQSFRIISCDT